MFSLCTDSIGLLIIESIYIDPDQYIVTPLLNTPVFLNQDPREKSMKMSKSAQ